MRKMIQENHVENVINPIMHILSLNGWKVDHALKIRFRMDYTEQIMINFLKTDIYC